MKDSAHRKLDGAERLLQGRSPLPSEGAYLASIASECAIKSLLMTKHTIRDTSDIGENHQLGECFGGKGGHSIERLLHHLQDDEFELLTGDLRCRITNSSRPYSLRYGEEKLEVVQARAEIDWARRFVEKSQESR